MWQVDEAYIYRKASTLNVQCQEANEELVPQLNRVLENKIPTICS